MTLDDNDTPSASDRLPSLSERRGYVYLLLHPAMYTADGQPLVKIGATRKHPIARATELSAGTGVPGDFTVSYYCKAPDAFALERETHRAFADVRVDEGREFFRCSVEEVIGFIRGYFDREYNLLPREGGEWLETEEGRGWVSPAAANAVAHTPWAELFATFPDDGGDRELSPEEAARCRELERGISAANT